MMTDISVPRQPAALGSSELACTLGSFRWMSMSSLYTETCDAFRRADRMSMGRPVLILDQISAIFAPRPNLPRVWQTPYLVPESTRPRRSGIAEWAMPMPLSLTVSR